MPNMYTNMHSRASRKWRLIQKFGILKGHGMLWLLELLFWYCDCLTRSKYFNLEFVLWKWLNYLIPQLMILKWVKNVFFFKNWTLNPKCGVLQWNFWLLRISPFSFIRERKNKSSTCLDYSFSNTSTDTLSTR